MTESKMDLSGLATLDEAVLKIAVSDGEQRLQAQFEAANSGDQRGLAWSGFVITIAIATIGASGALSLEGKHVALAVLTGFMAVGFAVSAFFAIDSVRPRDFAFPGNQPRNWLPHEWIEPGDHSEKRALVEQAMTLDYQIAENVTLAAAIGNGLQWSIDIAFWTVALSAVVALLLGVFGLLT